MNLKEAKEYLQNNGFAVQRLNECGPSLSYLNNSIKLARPLI